MTLALATCLELPEDDADEPVILAALAHAGVDVRMAAWDDPGVDWGAFDAVFVRSTWNYHHRLEDFLRWVDEVGARVPLWNPPAVIRWNAHKGYLLELAARGVNVVPTTLVRRGDSVDLAAPLARDGELVLKPAWSAGSYATVRVRDEAAGRAHLARWGAERDFLVQPYLPSVEDPGERCLVYFDDVFAHAVRKQPRFADGVEGTAPVVPDADERSLAEAVLAASPGPRRYARVDLARDRRGDPCLMELELIEPSLFLRYDAAALAAFVAALRRCWQWS